MIEYGWVMNFPDKPGFFPEIVDEDGKTKVALPKEMSGDKAVAALRQWGKDNECVVIHMPSGERL